MVDDYKNSIKAVHLLSIFTISTCYWITAPFFSYFTLIQRLLKFPVIEILLAVTCKQHFVYKTTSMGILEDTFTSCYLPLAASHEKRPTRIYSQVVE